MAVTRETVRGYTTDKLTVPDYVRYMTNRITSGTCPVCGTKLDEDRCCPNSWCPLIGTRGSIRQGTSRLVMEARVRRVPLIDAEAEMIVYGRQP